MLLAGAGEKNIAMLFSPGNCAGRERVNLHTVSTPSATVPHRSGLGWRLLQDWIPAPGTAERIGNPEGKTMAEHPNVTRIKDAYTAFAKGDVAVLEDFFAEDVLMARRRAEPDNR